MMLKTVLCLLGTSAFLISGFALEDKITVREALERAAVIAYPEAGRPVDKTVAEALREIASGAELKAIKPGGERQGPTITVSIADEDIGRGRETLEGLRSLEGDWMYFELAQDGAGALMSSRPHLVYALFSLLRDNWLDRDAAEFAGGKLIRPEFSWLEGGDNYIANPKWIAKGYDPEASVRELARLGFSHIPVNALAKDLPAEQGPPGEIYYRFYYFSPDLDQFVESPLNRGTYSPEYLEANLDLLKKNAALAAKYGLTPGMNISSPRSVPESLFQKYPYLRGARVDHPFRSYRPRFTLTLSHPAVRWHYAELMKALLREVPELGYLYIWTNDSGSGFEYTSSLYAGRNGGAYLVREWKSHQDIARAAGENVIRYFRTLCDAARKTNPSFRVITNLFSFAEEEKVILEKISDNIDLQVSPKELDSSDRGKALRSLPQKGSAVFTRAQLAGNFTLGVPFPWMAFELLRELKDSGFDKASLVVDPYSLAPYDINREVLRGFNLEKLDRPDSLIEAAAARWAGKTHAGSLVRAWRLSDQAVRAFPGIPLYGNNNWGFPWYRFFVRPFAPDIGKIPEEERAYYEKYMTATFNNPTLVDFSQDILWTLFTRDEADRIVEQCDRDVWKPLGEAIGILQKAAAEAEEAGIKHVLTDQRDRLIALKCYFRTLRNIAAWVAGVRGCIEAANPEEKTRRREAVRAMIEDEIENARQLKGLLQVSKVPIMPVAPSGESFNMYGENLPELINRKIALMVKHKDDEPYIDPDFMWRMLPGSGLNPKEFMKY